jgi:uncharacterized protein
MKASITPRHVQEHAVILRSRLAWLFVGALALAGCERSETPSESLEPLMTFDTARARIETATDTFHLTVELAESEPQRRFGLMRREQIPEEAGMIFLFEQRQPADASFYMFNTLIPLSIAFLDQEGRIGSIRDMEPCPSPYPQSCPM